MLQQKMVETGIKYNTITDHDHFQTDFGDTSS
jgi:hypothetical protein